MKYSAKKISKLLAQRVPALVERLGLRGEQRKDELVCLNPTRNDTNLGSFSINLKTGEWADFATDDRGDALALVAYIATKGDTKEAFKYALAFLGIQDSAKVTRAKRRAAVNGQSVGLSLAEYAAAKKLDEQFLKSLGVVDRSDQRGKYVAIPYFDLNGRHVATQQRWALNAVQGVQRFTWNSGAKTILYAPDRLRLARERGYVLIVEGASDVHTCLQHGVPAIGLPGAGNWNEKRDAPLFEGIGTIYVAHEGDAGAAALIGWLAKSAIRHCVRVVYFTKPLKDPSALYLSSPETFREALQAKLDAAVPWQSIEAERANAEEKAAHNECGELANSPDILARFQTSLAASGLVGEDRNAKILFLALVSRLLSKIVSVAYKGPSSGGKSYTVDRVLAHFPEEAHIRITGMSERALIYMEDDIAHRHIVLAEADCAGEMQDYLMRVLLSEGRLEYRLADKTNEGVRERRIVKEGPTGLIVTTTRVRLHPENETRLLSLTANDTPQQTRVVLRAVARREEIGTEVAKEWLALQAWLRHGERRVSIPYAVALAEMVSNSAVRMRRDFGQVLSLIEAHALLHRATRRRDDRGYIVATFADYAAVRELVFDLIAEGLAATVSKEVREAVNVVASLAGEHGVGLQAIATRLNIDKSAASRRCAAARTAGYLVNEETRKGRDARYKIGDPMPTDTPVLPTIEELANAIEGEGLVSYPLNQHCNSATLRNPPLNDRCSVAVLSEGVKNPPPSVTTDVLTAHGDQWEAKI